MRPPQEPKSRKMRTILGRVVATSLFVGLMAGLAYLWQTRQEQWLQLSAKDAKITQLNDRVASLQKESRGYQAKLESQNKNFIAVNEWGIKIWLGENADKVSYAIQNRTGNLIGAFPYDAVLTPKVGANYLTDKSCGMDLALYQGSAPPAPNTFKDRQIGTHYYVVTGSPQHCLNAVDDVLLSSLISNFSVSNTVSL